MVALHMCHWGGVQSFSGLLAILSVYQLNQFSNHYSRL